MWAFAGCAEKHGGTSVAAAVQTAVTACSPDTAQTDKDFEKIRADNPRSLGVATENHRGRSVDRADRLGYLEME